jgi:hypothetical protein
MTSKEQAEQLLHEYRMLFMDEGEDYGQEILVTMLSVKCALKAVDKIIIEMSDYYDRYDCTYTLSKIEYWQEVKQEIEKL